jgi:phosphopantetheine--protein transferase-like protein
MCEYPSVATPYIGIDLTETGRLADRLARTTTLADELFHPGEQAYAANQLRPIEHLAARFAAKEAVIKAPWYGWLRPARRRGDRWRRKLRGTAARRRRPARRRARGHRVDLADHVGALAAAVALARPRAPA